MQTAIKGRCDKLHEFYVEQGVKTPCPFCLKAELDNYPKISSYLAGMIIMTSHKMIQKYQGVDPEKVEDLTNLMTIVKNSMK